MISPERTMISPERNSLLHEYRIVVASATLDELEQHEHRRSCRELNVDVDSNASTADPDDLEEPAMDDIASSVSVASTVDIDNRHPYLMKNAELYAEENLLDTIKEPSAAAGPKFVGVNPSSAIHKLLPNTKGATDEHGEAPKNCVNFNTNCTKLFHALYHYKWQDAQQYLADNPEDATVWVARYVKKNEPVDIRWQLLPLHLYIALSGGDKKKEDSPPPIELLTALLRAYPQSTQCTDDQSMIPLHLAIRGNASLDIVEKLLQVDPRSVYRKDSRGRNAFVLSEKVYAKINKQPVGTEDEDRTKKYEQLMTLLSNAAKLVATPQATSQPKEKTVHADSVQENHTNDEGGDNTSQAQLNQLQIENLSLRKENAMLRHRADINGRILQQLVDKLQLYEEERSVNVENYNEIFGSKDVLDDRREQILVSISEDADDDKDGDKGKEKVESEAEAEAKEKQDVQVLGGDGLYNKRLERHLNTYTTPTKSNDDTDVVSSPAETEATTPATPYYDGGELSVSDYSDLEGRDIFRSKDSVQDSHKIGTVEKEVPAIPTVLTEEEEEMLVVE